MPAEPKLEKPTFDRMRLSTYVLWLGC
jgi:hypothetical protein